MNNTQFEEMKDNVRELVPGTTSILTGQHSSGEPYLFITYQPLDCTIQVPYSNNNDLIVDNYTTLLLSHIEGRITYYDNTIKSLTHFKETIERVQHG